MSNAPVLPTEVPVSVYGIKETKEALSAIIALVNAEKAAMADGKIDLMDFPLLLGVIQKVQPGVDGAKLIPKEIGDLTPGEANELITFVASELTILNDKAKSIVAAALVLIADLVALGKAIRA